MILDAVFPSVCVTKTSQMTAVMLLCFSAQADDRVRVERRDCAQFEFASAMNTVTEFYCHTQEQGVCACSHFPLLIPSSCSCTLPDTEAQGLRRCSWLSCVPVSSRFSLPVHCSVPGEPADLLSGAAHSVPPRVQLGKSSQESKVHVMKETQTHSAVWDVIIQCVCCSGKSWLDPGSPIIGIIGDSRLL